MATYAAGDSGTTRAVPPPAIYLQPIAPPVSFGLYGFFVATMLIATWILGWWGTQSSTMYFFTFSGALGGLIQFLSGIYCFKARDYIASGLITMWGTYWMAWALLQGLGVAGVIKIAPLDTAQPAFAIWFIPLGLYTLTGAVGALSRRDGGLALFGLLFTTGIGSLIFCVGLWTGNITWTKVAAGWFVAVGVLGWYVASMFMLRTAWRRVILPFGAFRREPNLIGREIEFPSEYARGDPGVRQGGA